MNYAEVARGAAPSSSSRPVFANPFDEIIALLEAMAGKRPGSSPSTSVFNIGRVGSLDPLVDIGLLSSTRSHASFVIGVTASVPATARDLAAMADDLPAGLTLGHDRVSRAQWMLVAAALTLGGSVRVGLEDNLYLPDGTMARSNGDLVAKARDLTLDVGPAPGHGRRGARAARHPGAARRGRRRHDAPARRRACPRPLPAAPGPFCR